MAKTYGGRWELIDSISRGGQGEVYRVRDLEGEHEGELALKRVINPRRHDRFRNEVEAIKRLDNPHVVKLIDHSALDADGAPDEKQFLVMPLARQDLSQRAELYRNSVDAVLQVTGQLVSALGAAHERGIVHRDVKPKNILFHTAGHDLWLADFGICLIRENERVTDTPEVVGPAQFMAPELDGGGQLEVTPAADVYSLGKVVYYIISGGIVLPRERLHEARYDAVFDQDVERQRLLRTLLGRMICDLPGRLRTMDEVGAEIRRIVDWEKAATASAMSPQALSRIESMKRKVVQAREEKDRVALTREVQRTTVQATEEGVLDRLHKELEAASEPFKQGGVLTSGVRRVASSDVIPLNQFRPRGAVEMWVRSATPTSDEEHVLRFSFCAKGSMAVHVHFAGAPRAAEPPAPQHVAVAVLPTYALVRRSGRPDGHVAWHLFTNQGGLHRHEPPKPVAPAMTSVRRQTGRLAPQAAPVQVQMCQFSTEQWPQIFDALKTTLNAALDSFTEAVERTIATS